MHFSEALGENSGLQSCLCFGRSIKSALLALAGGNKLFGADCAVLLAVRFASGCSCWL